MEDLGLKHIAPYLPYRINFLYKGEIRKVLDLHYYDIYAIKTILRPLSDLTKEIEIEGNRFVPFEVLKNILIEVGNSDLLATHTMQRLTNKNLPIEYILSVTPYIIIQRLFEWHFDVFRLIEKKWAVDYNTVFTNC